jgi:hypothetical protein
MILFDSFFRTKTPPGASCSRRLCRAARLMLGFLCAENLALDRALLHGSRPVISRPTHGLLRSGAAGLDFCAKFCYCLPLCALGLPHDLFFLSASVWPLVPTGLAIPPRVELAPVFPAAQIHLSLPLRDSRSRFSFLRWCGFVLTAAWFDFIFPLSRSSFSAAAAHLVFGSCRQSAIGVVTKVWFSVVEVGLVFELSDLRLVFLSFLLCFFVGFSLTFVRCLIKYV